MSDNSKIEWTDSTWNPIRGVRGKWHCTKVSAGCEHCYAERMNVRFGGPKYRVGADTLRLDKEVLQQPLRWTKPRMAFVCSMTDLFQEDIPDEWIDQVMEVIWSCPQHTFQVLTKRAERLPEYFEQWQSIAWKNGHWDTVPQILDNLWLGVSVENQEAADERIHYLIQTPAAVRFLSCEPLLGPICLDSPNDGWLTEFMDEEMRSMSPAKPPLIHWVIVGGESGPKARPMHPDWARSIRDQCQDVGVAFHFKQWGAWLPTETWMNKPRVWAHSDGKIYSDRHVAMSDVGWSSLRKVGKKAAGRLLDGRTWDEFPPLAEPMEVSDG